jgi:hypothetical protein
MERICKRLLFGMGWFFLLPCVWATGLTLEQHSYLEKTGDDTKIFFWTLKRDEKFHVISKQKSAIYKNLCDQSRATSVWKAVRSDMDIVAQRVGNVIRIQGEFQGEPIDRSVEVDDAPWYQALTYSLRTLLDSGQESMIFWVLRPDNMSALKLKAVRKDSVQVTMNGEEVDAQKITVRPTGLLSKVWRADYWFRAQDGVMLRYEAVHGPPGTPKTVVRLQG